MSYLPGYEEEYDKVEKSRISFEKDMKMWNDNSYDLFKDYLSAINFTKKNLMNSDDENWVKKYPPFMVNKILSAFSDTIMFSNEMNRNPFLDKDMQFQFLLNSVRAKKRFTPYLRADKLKDIECVKEYYGYNNEKAKSALDILTKRPEQIKLIKEKLFKGGKK